MRLWHFSSSVNSFFKNQVGLDVFVYFHTSCVLTAKALARLRGCTGSPEPSLVAYVINSITPWAGSVTEIFSIIKCLLDQLRSTDLMFSSLDTRSCSWCYHWGKRHCLQTGERCSWITSKMPLKTSVTSVNIQDIKFMISREVISKWQQRWIFQSGRYFQAHGWWKADVTVYHSISVAAAFMHIVARQCW